MTVQFDVIGTANNSPKPMRIRRWPTHEQAARHALRLDMKKWDDVWVEQVEAPEAPAFVPPPFPWHVQWDGAYVYVVDGNGKRLMSMLGTTAAKEFIASVIEERCAE